MVEGRQSHRREPTLLIKFLRIWISLTSVGLLLLLGLSLLGLRLPGAILLMGSPSWGSKVLGLIRTTSAVAAITAGLSILLLMDEQRPVEDKPEKMTFAGILYLLLTRQRSLFALVIFGLFGIIAIAYYVISSIFTVEYTGESGLVVHLPGQTSHYFAIDPYGWQNLGLRLKEGQTFEVEVTGRVSAAYLRGVDQLAQYERDLIKWVKNGKHGPGPLEPDQLNWIFEGPQGYSDAFYDMMAQKEGLPNFKNDPGLTVKGLRHNSVVGIIVGEGEPPCYKDIAKHEPCTTDYGPGKLTKPGYDYSFPQDQRRLLLLSSANYPIRLVANHTGVMWVEINDADEFRWDNAGLFFLKVTTH